MGMVEGIIYYVGPDTGRPIRPGQNLMLDDDGALCQTFRKALLESQRQFEMQIRVLQYPPMACHWMGCAQTAGVAAWRHDKVIEAVTVYLNGVDPKEEAIAVEMALASKPLPIPLYRWHELLQHGKRPVYATFLITPASIEDRVVATAASALANSFFSILGTV